MLPVLCIKFILPGQVSFVSDTVIPDNKRARNALVHLCCQSLHKFLKVVDLDRLQKIS